MTIASVRRAGFSDRLISALKAAGYPSSPTSIARQFNLRFPDHAITSHAARKWIVGEAVPTLSKLVDIAVWLNVDVAWLHYGQADSAPNLDERMSRDPLLSTIQALNKHERKLVSEFIDILLRTRGILQSERKSERAGDAGTVE